jgi:hypothetical protein
MGVTVKTVKALVILDLPCSFHLFLFFYVEARINYLYYRYFELEYSISNPLLAFLLLFFYAV